MHMLANVPPGDGLQLDNRGAHSTTVLSVDVNEGLCDGGGLLTLLMINNLQHSRTSKNKQMEIWRYGANE
jgi:hypothetical protein